MSTHKLHTSHLHQIIRWAVLHVNEELFQWVPTTWTLETNLKVDFFHVSEEWFQWATTIWKLEPILNVNFLHVNEESFQKLRLWEHIYLFNFIHMEEIHFKIWFQFSDVGKAMNSFFI